jgi:membrane-associated PAP2 superfamily phosphatase
MSRAPSNPVTFSAEREFWRTHLVLPAAVFTLLLALVEVFRLDRPIAHALYYNAATQRWLGDGAGAWLARDVIHQGGRWLARALGAAALLAWLATFFVKGLRTWRRTAGFMFAAIALSVGTVGLLKLVTNVDCPWDLSEFGGDRPYVSLFGDRPDSLPRAECFPGAHASSGFALVCLYFALRNRSRRKAHWALAAACAVGVVFSIGQEARGAHFLSHDLASAGIVWFIQLGLYGWLLGPATRIVEARTAPPAGGELVRATAAQDAGGAS